METEPLQDTLPPRHAIESDESEDEGVYPQSVKRNVPRPESKVVIDWHGPQEKRQALLVAIDEAGKEWAKGVELGEARGRVLVDDVEVALAYRPSWAEVTIVATSLRLPVYAIHEFASMVIAVVRPTSVVILDAYPVPSYISYAPSALYPSIRYLCTATASKNAPLDVEPFHPPNLIQSPAASFLSILESPAHAAPATLLLLPSAHIPPPAPTDFATRSGPAIHDEWEPSTIIKLHSAVNTLIGANVAWSIKDTLKRSPGGRASRRGDIGEGGMYI